MVGNAAFRSVAAASAFAGTGPALTALLDSADARTRRNAAGAAGNLVRHSGDAVAALASAGTAQRLLQRAVSDSDESVRSAALFSLGTLASYPQTRRMLLALRPGLDARLAAADGLLRGSAASQKAIRRLKRKLSQ